MKKIIGILIVPLPWIIKRWFLVTFWKYDIHPSAYIGLSYIYPDVLTMEQGTRIGHLNVAIHLHKIEMHKHSSISQRNWISGYPKHKNDFFKDFVDRKPQLIMHEDSAITKQHIVDCTDTVTIGAFTSIAGYRSQILTHSTSLEKNDQACAPITIGHHCFVGTGSILLPNAALPDQSVLAAGSVLTKTYTEKCMLYGGVPAKPIKKVNESYKFFYRTYRPKGNR